MLRNKKLEVIIHNNNLSPKFHDKLKLLSESNLNGKVIVLPNAYISNDNMYGIAARFDDVIIPELLPRNIFSCVSVLYINTKEKINFKELNDYLKNTIPTGYNVRNNLEFNTKFGKTNNIYSYIDILNRTLVKYKVYKYINLEEILYSIGTLGGGNYGIYIGEMLDNEFIKDNGYNYCVIIYSGTRKFGNIMHNLLLDASHKDKHSKINYFSKKDSFYRKYINLLNALEYYAQANNDVIKLLLLDYIKPLDNELLSCFFNNKLFTNFNTNWHYKYVIDVFSYEYIPINDKYIIKCKLKSNNTSTIETVCNKIPISFNNGNTKEIIDYIKTLCNIKVISKNIYTYKYK